MAAFGKLSRGGSQRQLFGQGFDRRQGLLIVIDVLHDAADLGEFQADIALEASQKDVLLAEISAECLWISNPSGVVAPFAAEVLELAENLIVNELHDIPDFDAIAVDRRCSQPEAILHIVGKRLSCCPLLRSCAGAQRLWLVKDRCLEEALGEDFYPPGYLRDAKDVNVGGRKCLLHFRPLALDEFRNERRSGLHDMDPQRRVFFQLILPLLLHMRVADDRCWQRIRRRGKELGRRVSFPETHFVA